MREGYDSSSWRTLSGEPVIIGTRLKVNKGSIIHYADIFRGDAIFNINVPAPVLGADRKFGFLQYNKNCYLYFKILNDELTAETSDGNGTTNSISIEWQTAWTNTATEFRVKWEAGFVSFFVGGVLQTQISDASVTGRAMSLYVADNSGDDLLLSYIDVQGIQGYRMSESNEDSSFGIEILEGDSISISESVTIFQTTLGDVSVSDDISISEDVTINLITP